MTRSIVDYRALGAAIVERLTSTPLPAALKSPASDFRGQHRALEAASHQAEVARAKRDEAIARLGQADEALDESNRRLADKVVGAELGARTRPFARVGGPTLSDLNAMAYADEVKAVRALVKKIEKVKPPAEVKRALADCARRAEAVAQALRALSKPQLDYERALHARDALLPGWERALRRLKRHAAVAWEDDLGTLAAVFAAPPALQRPVRRRAPATPESGPTTPQEHEQPEAQPQPSQPSN
jgi:hypothetical protein